MRIYFKICHILFLGIFLFSLCQTRAECAEVSDLRISLGGGVGTHPTFEGSRGNELTFTPHVNIVWMDTLFLNLDDGLGWNALNYKTSYGTWRAGPSVRWSEGRRENDDSALNGLGDVRDAVQPGVFVELEMLRGGLFIFANVRHDIAIGGESGKNRDGLWAELGAEANIPLRDSLLFSLSGRTTWANAKALEPFYSIDSRQSSRSGLATYRASSGIKDVTLEPALTWRFAKHWSLAGRVIYTQLLGSAASNPLVRERGSEEQLGGDTVLVWSW